MRLTIKLEDNAGELIAQHTHINWEGEDTSHFVDRGVEELGRLQRYLQNKYGDQLTLIPDGPRNY